MPPSDVRCALECRAGARLPLFPRPPLPGGGGRTAPALDAHTGLVHNASVVSAIPDFNPDGSLPPGVHWATWSEVADRFGTSPWRQQLLAGLRAALENLKAAGCRTVYLNGSFVTSKEIPNDYDACWEARGVAAGILDPVLLTFDPGRVTQKAKFRGELFPASAVADARGLSFLDFFQTDKDTGEPKGIIAMDLESLT